MSDDEDVVLCKRDKTKPQNLVVIVLRSYYPELADDPDVEEASKTAPDQGVQLLAKRGKKFEVLGPVGWWLYVKSLDTGEMGYIPSLNVAPITDDLSCEE